MERKITNIKERILYFTDFKGFSKEKFFEDLQITYGNFKGKAKNQALGSDVIERIITKYPEINAEWLLTGKGEMLKSEQPQPPVGPVNDNEVVALLKDKITLLEENKALLQAENERLKAEIQALKSVQSATVNQFDQPSQSKSLIQPLTQSTR